MMQDRPIEIEPREFPQARNAWKLVGGQIIYNVHDESPDCHEHGCWIHAPTRHHMRTWPHSYRGLTERICPHGIGHPDPDALSYARRIGNEDAGVHGCDGCCMSRTQCPSCEREMVYDGEDYICGACREEASAGSPGR